MRDNKDSAGRPGKRGRDFSHLGDRSARARRINQMKGGEVLLESFKTARKVNGTPEVVAWVHPNMQLASSAVLGVMAYAKKHNLVWKFDSKAFTFTNEEGGELLLLVEGDVAGKLRNRWVIQGNLPLKFLKPRMQGL